MNILVTGGCGFIGSNFINYYFNKYINVKIVCLDAMYYCASLENINENIRSSPRFNFINGNLTNYDLVYSILDNYNITHVVHFAAQSHVDNSFNNSLQYTEDNVKGTHTLLEAIRNITNKIKPIYNERDYTFRNTIFNLNTKKQILLLHFSTDEVYGESLNDCMKTEHSILCPTNPYAASKAAAEMYVMSYIHSFNLNAIITRGNNVYGPNQYPEKLIPKFIELLNNNMKCTIHGKGETIRNFIHVYDVCTAVDIILQKGIIGEIYNIGGNNASEFSVIEVASKLIEKIHISENINDYIEYIEDRPFNDKRYLISNNKLMALGWEQTIDFNNGLNTLF